MPPYKHLKRYRQIVGVLMDEGLDNTLDVLGLRRFAPVKSRLHGEREKPESVPVRLRHTLERLGPTFVKLGQVASTRPDLIPEEYIVELRKLQDDVSPFPDEEAFALIESELGAPVGESVRGVRRRARRSGFTRAGLLRRCCLTAPRSSSRSSDRRCKRASTPISTSC